MVLGPCKSNPLRTIASGSMVAMVLLAASALSSDAQQQTAAQALPDAPGYSSSGIAWENGAAVAQPGPIVPATLEGTVVDPNGEVLQGARVVLSAPGTANEREAKSGDNGEFAFSGLAAGTYKLTVSAPGMGTAVSPDIQLHAGEMRFLPRVILPLSAGITEVRVTASQEQIAEEEVHLEESQRVLGIFPNFYSSFDWNAPLLNTRQKFQLAFRSMIDPMAFGGAAAVAGAEQERGMYPGYGGGFTGYGKRFGAAYLNDFDGTMLGRALLPSLFHQDPRYFYKGSGSIRSRALYAIGQTFICRGDNGRMMPNYSEVLGSFAAGGLSNLYYPAANRGVSLTFVNGLIEIGGHAGTNLVREFVLRGLTSHVPRSATANP